MTKNRVLIVLLALAAASCAEGGGGPDAAQNNLADAAGAVFDAAPGSIDAPVTAFDAAQGTFDAAQGTFDAAQAGTDAGAVDAASALDAATGPDAAQPSDAGGACAAGNVMVSSTPSIAFDNTMAASDTITVTSAAAAITDVDVTIAVTHTYAGDVRVVLTAPSGTTVTLTTNNGSSNDDVFNGTTFDDDATELVTDTVYTNGVAVPLVVPEGALSTLIDENPNGTWTLDVVDDASGDSGVFVSWSLDIDTSDTPFTALPADTFTATNIIQIPDTSTIIDALTVANADVICDVDVTVSITHTFAGDIDLVLVSPTGTRVTLTTDNGGSADNVFDGTTFDDGALALVTDTAYTSNVTATPLVPEGALAALRGEDPNGTWNLEVADDASQDTGQLNGWSLTIAGCTCP